MQVTWYNFNRSHTLPGQIAAYQGDCLLLTDIHGNI